MYNHKRKVLMKTFYIFYGRLGSGVTTALIQKLHSLINDSTTTLALVNGNSFSIGNTQKLEFVSQLTSVPLLSISKPKNETVIEAETFLVDCGDGRTDSQELRTFIGRVSETDTVNLFFCSVIDVRDWILTGFEGLSPAQIIGLTPAAGHEVKILTFVERAMGKKRPSYEEATMWLQSQQNHNWDLICLGPYIDTDWYFLKSHTK